MQPSSVTEKHRSVLVNFFYYALILGAAYLFLRFAFWPLFPFLLAFFVAMLLQRPVNFFTKKTPLKRGFVSLICVLLIVAVVLSLVILVGTTAFTKVKDFITDLVANFESVPNFIQQAEKWLIGLTAKLPVSIRTALQNNIENIADNLLASFSDTEQQLAQSTTDTGFDLSVLKTPLTGVISTASKVPNFLVAFIVAVIACCFMTADYKRITNFIMRQLSPARRTALLRTKTLTLNTLGKMAKAYGLIMLITFTELMLGLGLLKLIGFYKGGYIPLIAMIIAIVDILPILGSGTILIPWAIISLFTGRVPLGIGLFVLYIIISVLRQFIEPRLVAGQLGLPPIATLVGMYFGLKLFSIIGMFIVPITINVLKVLNDEGILHLWKREGSAQAAQPLELRSFKIKINRKEEKKDEQDH